jgi:3D (Asp-Asp-Asp) domain-containing protein
LLRSQAKQVTVTDGSTTRELWTTARTTAEAISDAGVEVGPHDWLEPASGYEITDGSRITVHRVAQLTEDHYTPLPYSEVLKPNGYLPQGSRRVIQPGRDGQIRTTYSVTYEDGQEKERTQVAQMVMIPKVDAVIEYGTIAAINRGGRSYTYRSDLDVVATAYSIGFESTGKRPGDPDYGITRSGLPVKKGYIAVDPRVMPLGTWVYVEGLDRYSARYDGIYYAADTGGAIKGNRIDIYVETESEASLFGAHRMRLFVLTGKPQ